MTFLCFTETLLYTSRFPSKRGLFTFSTKVTSCIFPLQPTIITINANKVLIFVCFIESLRTLPTIDWGAQWKEGFQGNPPTGMILTVTGTTKMAMGKASRRYLGPVTHCYSPAPPRPVTLCYSPAPPRPVTLCYSPAPPRPVTLCHSPAPPRPVTLCYSPAPPRPVTLCYSPAPPRPVTLCYSPAPPRPVTLC